MLTKNRLTRSLLISTCLFAGSAAQAQIPEDTASERSDVVYTCKTCHGSDGRGNPVVRAPGLDGREGWYIRRQLENFRDGVRGTQKSYISGLEMQAAASVLDDEAIDRIINAIEDWRPVPSHENVDGDPARGQQLYGSCATCHGREGQGVEAVGAPALAGKSDWYLMNQLRLFKSGYRGTHPDDHAGAQMRAMTQSLDVDSTMKDVVAYIRTISETESD
ncbi:MAG: c-type cytochrome [Pseudohongiellaceae bacterium]